MRNHPLRRARALLLLIMFALPVGVVAPGNAASNSGVEFWAVDLDNIEGGAFDTFAIVVSNQGNSDATVTVSTVSGQISSATVPPDELHTFPLPRAMVDGTTKQTTGVYRVASDQPIVAYQFNPLNNVYTNDASMLLPTPALGTEYYVMSREQTQSNYLRGLMAIVATQPGETTVEVTPKATTLAGPGIPSIAAGATQSFTLQRFEVLNIETQDYLGDLTGSHVVADKPVSVFGGGECSFVPSGHFACDHTEEQLFPTSIWGSQYPFCRSQPRGSEPDLVRVLASQDDTAITFDPPVAGAPTTLQAGAWAEVTVAADTVITATKPISVGQYLVSQSFNAGTGDPSMIMGVPATQFRRNYMFLTPNTFAFDWVTVTAPVGSSLELDGTAVPSSSFTEIGDSGMACARVAVTDGVHRIAGDAAFGIAVYGYDQYASYGYTGGLDVRDNLCEDGLAALRDTPLDGVVSKTVHDNAEPVVDSFDEELGDQVHRLNCDIVATMIEDETIDPVFPGGP